MRIDLKGQWEVNEFNANFLEAPPKKKLIPDDEEDDKDKDFKFKDDDDIEDDDDSSDDDFDSDGDDGVEMDGGW